MEHVYLLDFRHRVWLRLFYNFHLHHRIDSVMIDVQRVPAVAKHGITFGRCRNAVKLHDAVNPHLIFKYGICLGSLDRYIFLVLTPGEAQDGKQAEQV